MFGPLLINPSHFLGILSTVYVYNLLSLFLYKYLPPLHIYSPPPPLQQSFCPSIKVIYKFANIYHLSSVGHMGSTHPCPQDVLLIMENEPHPTLLENDNAFDRLFPPI